MKKFFTTTVLFSFLAGVLTAQTTTVYSYTGTVQTLIVPGCTDSITFDMYGAQGGGTGGLGGRVTGAFAVTPGATLYIYVGGQGGPEASLSPGGWNGGGTAGQMTTMYPGAGGGGASDIRVGGQTLTDRVVVAGGGGGSHPINSTTGSGAGGGLTGGNVVNNGNTCMLGWATGGSQSAGGLNSTWSGTCCSFTVVPDGSLGLGGDGAGPAVSCNGGDGGAGGGGGYYGGGGGGTYTSGGGGSSYTSINCTGVVHTQGIRSGNGEITLTYGAGSIVNYVQSPSLVCTNWPTFPLSGATPLGGTYSGPGVTGNNFSPLAAGPGIHNITYTYIDISPCTTSVISPITVSLCAGDQEFEDLVQTKIFPNPATTSLNMIFANSIADLNWSFIDIQGRAVLNGNMKSVFNGKTVTLDISSLSAGVYYLNLLTAGGAVTKKIVVQR